MNEYVFEFLPFTSRGDTKPDYHEVIRFRGTQGWRLAQIIEKSIMGRTPGLELIFERPAQAPQDAMRTDSPGR